MSSPSRPLVVCGLGDGTTQQGEFLEACAEARRRRATGVVLDRKQSVGDLDDDRRPDVLQSAGRRFTIRESHRSCRWPQRGDAPTSNCSPIIGRLREARSRPSSCLTSSVLPVTRVPTTSRFIARRRICSRRRTRVTHARVRSVAVATWVCQRRICEAVRQTVIREVALAEQAAFAGRRSGG